MAQPVPAPVEDRSEEMEAEIARLLQERVEMEGSHDEALHSLDAAVSRAQEEAERSEDEVRVRGWFIGDFRICPRGEQNTESLLVQVNVLF